MAFVHLHVHTQYSILDGQASIEKLFNRAEELGMPGLAITDHGNMYGVKEFFKYAKKHPSVKPIIGCEVYVSKFDHRIKDKEHRFYSHLILLAKNYNGYKNLMKIVSTGFIEGLYNRPRISREVLEKYHEDLICCSACIAGEVPKAILADNMEEAEKIALWYKSIFKDDYYLEVQLHKTQVPGLSLDLYEDQRKYNKGIFELSEKCGIKVIASNDVHFVNKEDGLAHDRLICLTTNVLVSEPNRLHYTQQEYLKSEEEMAELFPDHPEVISNTLEILEKVEKYSIDRGHVLPQFDKPESFINKIDSYLEQYKEVIDAGRYDEEGKERGEDFNHSVAYLCHLTYEGAKLRYGEINDDITERIDFELKTVSRMGFPDYFLIVQDFIAYARSIGISVGPGRGSAAGSVVSYCLGITNLDPIKYNLLFERFLNPERISMPDIDVDFDDERRHEVIKYVQDRYGVDHISHVITFGTMAAKMAIKDVARIENLPIPESNRLTKLIPDRPLEIKIDGEVKKIKPTLNNCVKHVQEIKDEYENGEPLIKEVLNYALQLEGSIRQTGIHACAMIIGRDNLTEFIPISIAEDKSSGQKVWVSQFEGSFIEEVGMLKMDFLGLRTLSIIKECIALVKKRHGIEIDIEKIPIDDPAVYELYSRGDTKSIFQFESDGMKEWLIKLHPQRFEDLIAMNALYRPGPMDYIPQFVARKRGEEEIAYDLPEMEEYLKETYGVTVYQEQVMLISQKIAGFSKGKADKLRKAMGKKQRDVLDSLYSDFMEGSLANGHPKKILEKIWKDWVAFAEYAFNKSHATCYSWVSYQTAWLKAHYPSEFQAANLSQNLSNMEEIKKIMADCKKNKIKVLSPDINESDSHFTVNKEGNVRFGLGGIKGFGGNIVEAIISEREKNGLFESAAEFMERMAGIVNRRSLESLVYAGALDSFEIKRSQYFEPCLNGNLFIDELVRYAELYKRDTLDSSSSLFGEAEEMKPIRPEIPLAPKNENTLELLQKEKELVGMYISSHPLDKYAFEIENFTNCELSNIQDIIDKCETDQNTAKLAFTGIITDKKTLTTKGGTPGLKITIEDYSGNYEIALFGKEYESFISYMDMNNQLFFEAEIRPRYFVKKEEASKKKVPYSLRVTKVRLLGNISEDFVAGFIINVFSHQIDAKFRKDLATLLSTHPGKIPVNIMLHDTEKKYNIDFHCKKFLIGISSEFLEGLNNIGLSYKIKRK